MDHAAARVGGQTTQAARWRRRGVVRAAALVGLRALTMGLPPALVAACASPRVTDDADASDASSPSDRRDVIVDAVSGAALSLQAALARMLAADFVLLGELHDNPHHHARRAALLRAWPQRVMVIAEHLPRTVDAVTWPAEHDEAAVLRVLEAADFDARGWRWPAHAPLFTALAHAGHTLRGGNLPREAARQLAREGLSALPADLRPIVEAAPLVAAARKVLEDDLLRSHCGHLPPERAAPMSTAQRGRDAAMAQALMVVHDRMRTEGKPGPVVLLAGNGHVRRDYGVPQLLQHVRPQTKVVAVGFVELDRGGVAPRPLAGLYDVVWATPRVARTDPCADMVLPPPASRAASG